MSKEIQVIDFSYLRTCAEHNYIYETGEAKSLLNYITNLQQENARLKDKLKDIKKILDADYCVENIYQAICQYLDMHDFELNLDDYLKEN